MPHADFLDNFKNAILDPSYLDEGDKNFISCLKDGEISTKTRISVYRNNVMVSLTDAVITIYPMTEKIVGKEFLQQAVKEFILKNLPDQGNINFYGGGFPDFIKSYQPASHIPYLEDMTRLEWAWELSFRAKDDAALNLEYLQSLPQENLPALRPQLRHAVHLIKSDFPLDKIIDFCRNEDDLDEKKNSAPSPPNLEEGGAHLMIYRPDLKVQLRKITEAEYFFLSSLQKDMTIIEATENALDTDQHFNLPVSLQKFFELEIFSSSENSTIKKIHALKE